MKSKYLLLMDPREDYLSLQESAINCFYKGEVLSLTTAESIKDLLEKRGHPELIVVDSGIMFANDSQVYHHFERSKVTSPIIATSQFPLPEGVLSLYPSLTSVIEKEKTLQSIMEMIKNLTTNEFSLRDYIPIKASFLFKNKMNLFDLYLKLSDKKFVKIFKRGEVFSDSDLAKMEGKGVTNLYLKSEDSHDYLHFLEQTLIKLGQERSEDTFFALENIEAFERVAKILKWTPEVLESAKKGVNEAIKILSKDKKVVHILKVRLNDTNSEYSQHIGLLTYLVSALAGALGMGGETAQMKLALAALIHDVAVRESYYSEIKEWNKKAADKNEKSPEVIKYRMHPFDALKLLDSLPEVPPDIDQIILQHHEVKDGSGFPRGITSSRISALSSIFIIVEDLLDFIEDGENLETSIKDFITWGRFYYDSGHFMKIYAALEDMIKD
ncbi:MAG: HD-GYP domain-containing protein [Bacteriovoracia bacterium]